MVFDRAVEKWECTKWNKNLSATHLLRQDDVLPWQKYSQACRSRDFTAPAVTRIRTWVVAATTQSTNHYTITAVAWTTHSSEKYDKKVIAENIKKNLPGGESNPGLPRDRRRYSPLYYRGSHEKQQNQVWKDTKCLRPHHVECTGSRLITEVKQRRARLVLGWVTAWEYRVL